MLKSRQLWLAAVVGVVGVFFMAKGEKVTQFFAGWVALLGAFSVSEWGVIGGLCLGLSSFILTWVYKHKNYQVLKQKVERGEHIEALLDEDS